MNGTNFGYAGMTDQQVSYIRLVKFTRNKLRVVSVNYSSKQAANLIKRYYRELKRTEGNNSQKFIEIQANFSAYRSWLIDFCKNIDESEKSNFKKSFYCFEKSDLKKTRCLGQCDVCQTEQLGK
jgi:hypothetical protein